MASAPKFNPRDLTYDANGIPVLRPSQIEAVAMGLLEFHCPLVLRQPSSTPVLGIIDKLRSRTNLKYEMRDLGSYKGLKVLGCIDLRTNTLSLDTILTGERRMSLLFTAAHEIGHWVLHRYNYKNWKLNEGEKTGALIDDEKTLRRLSQKTPREWLEYQANVFASCLVMPRTMFTRALSEQQAQMGIVPAKRGDVFLTKENYSQRDYFDLQTRLAEIFDVSVTSVRVRVETLKLLREGPIRQQQTVVDDGPPTQNIHDLIGRVFPRKTS
jgi:Zn-dependent peptidase ImmA (M78 family)